MIVIFICLSMAVIIFLLMISLTLFRIEKSVKTALTVAERKIVKDYGRK
ncbi:MAG: hypothetical protein LBC70_02165 [Chitinispirillales bacterium]|jgi:hypothetical protein|nr:hypothetical protein [Chitinispirillales bacterium]